MKLTLEIFDSPKIITKNIVEVKAINITFNNEHIKDKNGKKDIKWRESDC